jgi:hypothetical protein
VHLTAGGHQQLWMIYFTASGMPGILTLALIGSQNRSDI